MSLSCPLCPRYDFIAVIHHAQLQEPVGVILKVYIGGMYLDNLTVRVFRSVLDRGEVRTPMMCIYRSKVFMIERDPESQRAEMIDTRYPNNPSMKASTLFYHPLKKHGQKEVNERQSDKAQ